jgi:chemosensory pili system protein ChpA (sensor histidine kinase/response regulator)
MPKTILVADDDKILTKLLKKYLEDHALDVLVANDGEEALQKLEHTRPDLIVLDIQMPKVNGYSFLFEMRKLEQCAQIPVIILTCKEEMEEIFRVEGVKEYIVKPVSNEDLLNKIKKHL